MHGGPIAYLCLSKLYIGLQGPIYVYYISLTLDYDRVILYDCLYKHYGPLTVWQDKTMVSRRPLPRLAEALLP